MKRAYEGDIAGRYTQMLIVLLSPPWSDSDAKDFGDVFTQWSASVSQLEMQFARHMVQTTVARQHKEADKQEDDLRVEPSSA